MPATIEKDETRPKPAKVPAPEESEPRAAELTFAARIKPATAPARVSPDLPRRPVPEPSQDLQEGAPRPMGAPITPPAPALVQRFEVQPVREDSQPQAQPLDTVRIPRVEEAPVSKAPLKDISMQWGQSPSQRIEVRLVERGGELKVAVKAADSDVAQGLRQGLGELTTKLSDSGYRAETWRPGDIAAAVASAAPTREPADTSGHSQDHGSQSQSHSGSQQQDRGSQQHHSSKRPRWVQELEGEFNGS